MLKIIIFRLRVKLFFPMLVLGHVIPIREAPPIFLKIGEVQLNLDFQPKLDFIMW